MANTLRLKKKRRPTMPNDGVKWPIPTVPWGQTRHKIAFDDASEEVKAKFRELYPVSFNKEMGGWFGISECMVKYIGQRLGLRKNRTVIQRRNNEPYKYRVRAVLDKIKAEDPKRYADVRRRIKDGVCKAWHRARIQAEYGLPRTVRLHVTPLTKKQQLYKNHMATVHRYFPDPDHPYWVCFDSQTTRSKRMEKNAMAMGLEIVEGEE